MDLRKRAARRRPIAQATKVYGFYCRVDDHPSFDRSYLMGRQWGPL